METGMLKDMLYEICVLTLMGYPQISPIFSQ